MIEHVCGDRTHFRSHEDRAVVAPGQDLDVPMLAFRELEETELVQVLLKESHGLVQVVVVLVSNQDPDPLLQNEAVLGSVVPEQVRDVVLSILLRDGVVESPCLRFIEGRRVPVFVPRPPYRHPRVPLLRSEEHTSELQSRGLISYAVFCLKKKTHTELHSTSLPSPRYIRL